MKSTFLATDVAEPINTSPLYKIELQDGSFIRFYSDLSCDCGERRNKRDKSKMHVGYRVHTLCVADVDTGIAFPLLSLTVAANHHDSKPWTSGKLPNARSTCSSIWTAEPCPMKTHATVSAQAVFSQMTGLLKVMAELRSVPKSDKENRQEVLPFAANS